MCDEINSPTVIGEEKANVALSSLEDLETQLRLLEDELSLLPSSTTDLDEPVLSPIRWLDRNIASLGGLAMLIIIAAKIAIAARMNPETINVLVQFTSINDLTISTISNLLPISPFIIILLIYRVASTSTNIFVSPIAFGATMCIVIASAVIDPFPLFVEVIVLAVAIWVAIFRESNSRRTRKDLLSRLHEVGTELRQPILLRTDALASQEENRRNIADYEEKLGAYETTDELRIHVQEFLTGAKDRAGLLESKLQTATSDIQDIYKKFEDVAVAVRNQSTKKKSGDWDSQSSPRKFLNSAVYAFTTVAVVILTLALCLGYSLWLPSRQFVNLKNHHAFSGYELNQSNTEVTILEHSSREIVTLPITQVRIGDFCIETNASPQRTVYQILLSSNSQPYYSNCKDWAAKP